MPVVACAPLTPAQLGSGPGYVEHFYVKNGYRQAEYMVVIPGGRRDGLGLGGLTVLRERRWAPDELVLNIATPGGYDPAAAAALGTRLGASQVCCIFTKPVGPGRGDPETGAAAFAG